MVLFVFQHFAKQNWEFFQFFTFATFGSKRVYWLSRLFAVYWLRGRFETVIKLYSVYPIDILTEVVRNQEPNVSQNLQAWVVVLAKTLQHDKTAITKHSNYFQEIREEWLRYDWGRTEWASVLLDVQRVWSHPNIRDLLIRGWRRQGKRRLKRKSPLRLFELTFLPNVGKLSWSWISKTKGERKFCCGLFTSSIKSEMRHFHVIHVQWRLKKCYKNACCSRGAVVAHIK